MSSRLLISRSRPIWVIRRSMKEVPAGDPNYGSDSVAVGVGGVDGQVELLPVVGQAGRNVVAVERFVLVCEADPRMQLRVPGEPALRRRRLQQGSQLAIRRSPRYLRQHFDAMSTGRLGPPFPASISHRWRRPASTGTPDQDPPA